MAQPGDICDHPADADEAGSSTSHTLSRESARGSPTDAAETYEPSTYKAVPEVSDEVIAAITERVKRECEELLKQTGSENETLKYRQDNDDEPHVEVYAPPSPSHSEDMSLLNQGLKPYSPVSPSSSGTQPEEQRAGIRFSVRGDHVPNKSYPPEEQSTINQKWGRLFDDEGTPTQRLGQLLRGIGNHIVQESPPQRSLVISPAKMTAFYTAYALEKENHPWKDIFSAGQSISELYQDLGCQYHLVQEDHYSAPTIPSLSVVGFAHWMTLQILVYPETEWRRMEKILLEMPVDADGELVDGKPERLPKQLPRHLLPKRKDPASQKLLDISVYNLLASLGSKRTRSASNSKLQSGEDLLMERDRKPYNARQYMPSPERGPRRASSPPLKTFSQSTPTHIGPRRVSSPPLRRFSKSIPDYIHTRSKYGPETTSSSSTTGSRYGTDPSSSSSPGSFSSYGSVLSFPPPPPGPPPIDIRSRDERQYRRDLGNDKSFHGEFISPRDAERWDRYQETQFDKPYDLASITVDPRNRRGAPMEEWYRDRGRPRPSYEPAEEQIREPSPVSPIAAEVTPRESVKSIIPIATEDSHENQIQPQEKQVDQTRLSALIKSGQSSEGLELSSKPEEVASGPDLFIQTPRMYQEDVANLQRQIFELGGPALRNIQDQGDFYELYPPYSVASDSADSSDRIRKLILANIDLITAINDGLNILAKIDFCGSTYNVIVSDSDRANVLRVVPIQKETLQVLTKLLQEINRNYGSPIEDDLSEETLEDVEEATRLIISNLGLDVPFPDFSEQSLSEKVDILSQIIFSILSTLFLALVSFVTSHLYMENVSEKIMGWTSFTQLVIPTLDHRIVMTPRRLRCLDGFTKSPVWAFHTVPASNPSSHFSVDGRRYYLSVFLADFADLWGPLRLQYMGGSIEMVSEVLVRGGAIQTAQDEAVTVRASETLCHWLDWTDVESDFRNSQRMPFSTVRRLLIGTPRKEPGFNEQRFLISATCVCDGKKRYSDSRDVFELKTRIPSWSLAERTAQISGGAYVNLLYGHTWKFNAGWTLKDVIVVDWVDQSRDPSHAPKPFYLDYLTVLDISRCTGHSRRVSLWNLFREDALRRYLRQVLDDGLYRDFETVVQFFPPDASFIHIWKSVSKIGQEVFKAVSREVLAILRSTGVGEDGSLQAWDITSSNRLDGRKVRPPWRAMVKDDSACATFAIMTDKCVNFADSTRPPSPPYNTPATCSPVLNTIICITTEETVLSLEARVYTPPNSLKEEDARPDWALTSTTFDKWKVKLSEDDSSYLALCRTELMKSGRDQAGPDLEPLKRIENRRLARQHRQTLPSTNGYADSSKECAKESSSRNWISPKSGNEKAPATQEFNNISPSRPVSNPSRRSICNGSFDFKNGQGENIGKLILEPPQVIDLRTMAEGSALTLRWEESKSGLLNAIKAKEKVIDKRVVEWTERKMNGVLPWAISRVVERCTTEPFAVEHIRGGTLGAGQKVLQTYIS